MKRILYIGGVLLALMLSFGLCAAGVSAEEARQTPDGLVYTVNDGTQEVAITGYVGSETVLTIPSVIDGKPVTAIAAYAFRYNTALTSVTLPDGLKTIDEMAFLRCEALQAVTIPDSVSAIGRRAFMTCRSLTQVTVPPATMEYGVFQECTALQRVTLADGLKTIPQAMFYECTSLSEIVIPDSVETIGIKAFQYCYALTRADIPASVTAIGGRAFYGCTALEEVVFSGAMDELPYDLFRGCAALKRITFPEGLKTIGKNVFDGCASLRDPIIPDTVTSIGNSAFKSCTSLGRVVLPDGLTTIEAGLFYYACVDNLIIPNSVTTIKGSATGGDSSPPIKGGYVQYMRYLGTKDEWDAVSLGYGALWGLRNPIEFAADVQQVDDMIWLTRHDGGVELFRYLGTAADVTVPSTVNGAQVTGLDAYALYGNATMTNIRLPDGLKRLGDSALSACPRLERVDVPESVTRIEKLALADNKSLTVLTLPARLEHLGGSAFLKCPRLRRAAVPDGPTTIPICLFQECSSLEFVAIPDSVTLIDDSAFGLCTSLKTVFYSGTPAQWKAVKVGPFNPYFGRADKVFGDVTLRVRADGTLAVSGVSEGKTSVRIPTAVDGMAVTAVDPTAFDGAHGLTAIRFGGSEAAWNALVDDKNTVPDGVYMLFNTESCQRYPDVRPTDWYDEAVEHVAVKGFMKGFQSGSFGPAATMQRQDFVLILARIAGVDLDRYAGRSCGLRDVTKGAYYAPAVTWGVENGIITGYQNGTFGVGDPITREQVCTIFYRFLQSPTVTDEDAVLAAFPDKHAISPFAVKAVAWAVENGVMSGMGNGRMAPTAKASRAQVATIVMRMDRGGLFDTTA